jgi:YD repeat-containing protein
VWQPGQTGATAAGDGSANYTYTYCLTSSDPGCESQMTAPYVQTNSLFSAASNAYTSSFQIYDSLLRPRQTQDTSDLGSDYTTITDTLYDSRGNVAITNGPYSQGPVPGCPDGPSGCLRQTTEGAVFNETAYSYDGAGRETEAAFSDQGTQEWDSAWQYPYGDEVIAIAPQSAAAESDPSSPLGVTATYTDARGRTSEIDQYHSTTAATGDYDATTYEYAYTDGGSTMAVTDAGGNTWQQTDDLLGRVVSDADPDTGTTTSTYNDGSQLTSVTDPVGKAVSYTYDAAGRKTAEYAAPVSGQGSSNQLATWTYDTATLDNKVSNGTAIGQLASETSYVGGSTGSASEAYTITTGSYSHQYQPETVTYCIPDATITGALGGTSAACGNTGQSYQFSYGYDPAGDMTSQTYPAGGGLQQETVDYYYDEFGYPSQTSGIASAYAAEYAADATYDFDGQPTEVDLTTGGGAPVSRIDYGYQPDTRQLSSSSVSYQATPGSNTYSTATDTTYQYDASGDVITADDPVTSENQCYTYDYLDRLTNAWSQAAGCPQDPSTPAGPSGIGGPAPYQQSLTYDNGGSANGSVDGTTGNITDSKVITGLPGPNQVTTDVSYAGDYPAYGAPQPHAPTGYTTTTNSNPVATTSSWTPKGSCTRPLPAEPPPPTTGTAPEPRRTSSPPSPPAAPPPPATGTTPTATSYSSTTTAPPPSTSPAKNSPPAAAA